MHPQNVTRRRRRKRRYHNDDDDDTFRNENERVLPRRRRWRWNHSNRITVLSFAVYLVVFSSYSSNGVGDGGGNFCDGFIQVTPSTPMVHSSVPKPTMVEGGGDICESDVIAGGGDCRARTTILYGRRRRNRASVMSIDNGTPSSSSSSSSSQPSSSMNIGQYEQREKRELEWLVKSTSQILSTPSCSNPNEVKTPPANNNRIIDKILPVATTWVRRCTSSSSTSSTQTSIRAAHVVEKLLQRFWEEIEGGNHACLTEDGDGEVLIRLYNLWIEAWAKGSDAGDGEDLLRRMMMTTDKDGEAEGETTTNAMTAPERAQEILDRLEQMAHTKDCGSSDLSSLVSVKPNLKSYYLCLKAWVRCRGGVVALDKMESILERIESNLVDRGQIHVVGRDNLNTVEETMPTGTVHVAKQQQGQHQQRHENEEERLGVIPSYVRCYNLYLYALANNDVYSPKIIVNKATNVLKKLQQRSEILRQQQQQHSDNDEVEEGEEYWEDPKLWTPNTDTYHQVISCFSKLRTVEGARSAHAIYDSIITTTADGDDDDIDMENEIRPDTSTANELMSCWLRIGTTSNKSISTKQIITKIESILRRMNQYRLEGFLDCAPDRISVNTYMTAIIKQQQQQGSRKKDAAIVQQVLDVLEGMEAEYGVEPDQISYMKCQAVLYEGYILESPICYTFVIWVCVEMKR